MQPSELPTAPGPTDAPSDAAQQLLLELVRAGTREALIRAFEFHPGKDAVDDKLDMAVLKYLNQMVELKLRSLIEREIDAALERSFEIYKQVHQMEERRMDEIAQRACVRAFHHFRTQISSTYIPNTF